MPASWLEGTSCTQESWVKSANVSSTVVTHSISNHNPQSIAQAQSAGFRELLPAFPHQASTATQGEALTLQQKLSFSSACTHTSTVQSAEHSHERTQPLDFSTAPVTVPGHSHVTTNSQSYPDPTPMLLDSHHPPMSTPQGPVPTFSAAIHSGWSETGFHFSSSLVCERLYSVKSHVLVFPAMHLQCHVTQSTA